MPGRIYKENLQNKQREGNYLNYKSRFDQIACKTQCAEISDLYGSDLEVQLVSRDTSYQKLLRTANILEFEERYIFKNISQTYLQNENFLAGVPQYQSHHGSGISDYQSLHANHRDHQKLLEIDS